MGEVVGSEAQAERGSLGERLWDALAGAGLVQINFEDDTYQTLHRDVRREFERAAVGFAARTAGTPTRKALQAAAAILDDAGFSVIKTAELMRLRNIDANHGWKMREGGDSRWPAFKCGE